MTSKVYTALLSVFLFLFTAFAVPSHFAESQVVSGVRISTAYCITAPEQAMIDQINTLRKKQGVGELVPSVLLGSMAEGHSIDMRDLTWTNERGKDQVGYFDHTTPSGQSLKDRAAAVGFPSTALLGENILWGESDPQKAYATWKASQPHYTNMVDPRFKSIGVGFAEGSGPDGGTPSNLWTSVFGSIALNGDVAKPCENPAPTQIVTPSPTVATLPTVVPTQATTEPTENASTPIATNVPTEMTPTAVVTETPQSPVDVIRNILCTGAVKADGTISVNCVNAPQSSP